MRGGCWSGMDVLVAGEEETQCVEPSLESRHPSQLRAPNRVNRLNGAEVNMSLKEIVENVGVICLWLPAAKYLNGLI